jgi:aromatic-L-amino-acid/L-tryptophan decarboxylase
MTIRQVGREGYVRMLRDDIALARELFELARKHEELEAMTCALSIATFRFVPKTLRARVGEPEVETALNDLNGRILAKLQTDGVVYLSNAVISGRFALRSCIVNFRTTSRDIRAVVESAVEAGRTLSA